MRQIFSRHDHLPERLTARLDNAARRMNPVLALVIIGLLILNFACAVNLIDWRNLPDNSTPLSGPSASVAPAWGAAPSLPAAPTGQDGHIGIPPD
jgi:hypothetical protein